VTEVHEKLRPISSAKYNSKDARPGCLKDTRVTVLQELSTWADDDAPGLSTLWLNGMAGTGKSAISRTFAKNMEKGGLLGASFFIDRQVTERRDPHRIVQSIAYDLAVRDHARLRALWSSLSMDPTIMDMQLQDQVKKLIKEPMHGVSSQSLLILIDGLDECTSEGGAKLLSTLVSCLSEFPIRLFISSRGDQDIVDAFHNFEHAEICLQNRPSDEVSKDVQRYWEDSLDSIRGMCRLVDWRTRVSLDLLVELTGPLFIYATTILRIIKTTKSNPITKLNELLGQSRSGSGSTNTFEMLPSHSAMDGLYSHILTEAIKDDGHASPECARQLHNILELVIFARDPLTSEVLSSLLPIDAYELQNYLVTLSSVLFLPDDTDTSRFIRPLHQSFPDFILQRGGQIHPELTLDPTTAAGHITELCLRQCNDHLHLDMCNIHDPSLFNDEIPNLEALISNCIPEALRYSCKFWPVHCLEHIRAAGSHSPLPSGLEQFCTTHLLHWVEVLSLIKGLDTVRRVLPELIAVMDVGSTVMLYVR
jgi:hypothetical protein